MKADILELSGSIQKISQLKNVETNIIKGTMVLQTEKPFNGYYSADPDEYIPQSFFLITKKEYQTTEIARVATKIKKYLEFDFDAVRAEVTLYNEVYTAIRLYDIIDYNQVELIQRAFASEGVVFKTSNKTIEGSFLVKVWKVFLLSEIETGLYKNMSKSKMFYFTLPSYISYTHFQTLLRKVRNNWDGKSFDAAQAMFYRKVGVEEGVRIFSNHITDEMMKDLRDKFLRFFE